MSAILILEDDSDLAAQWREALTARGHDCVLTKSATEAIEEVRAAEYDLLIVDMYIRKEGELVPDGGVILLTKMRQIHSQSAPKWWRTAPILAVSGGGSIAGGFDPLKTARDLRATASLRKPIEIDELIETAEHLIAEAGAASKRA